MVLRALRMKKLAGDICAVVTGRHTHPIAMTVGGFTHFPQVSELKELRQRLVESRPDVDATVDLFATLPWPQFERDTEYVSLSKPDEYAFIDGDIVSSDGSRLPAERYKRGDERVPGAIFQRQADPLQPRFLHGRGDRPLQQ